MGAGRPQSAARPAAHAAIRWLTGTWAKDRRLFAKLVINAVHTLGHWLAAVATPASSARQRPAITDAEGTSDIGQRPHNEPGLSY